MSLYCVLTLGVVFFLALYGYSANVIIAAALAFATVGGVLLLRLFLSDL